MKFLKGLALFILSSLLFLSLSIFGFVSFNPLITTLISAHNKLKSILLHHNNLLPGVYSFVD